MRPVSYLPAEVSPLRLLVLQHQMWEDVTTRRSYEKETVFFFIKGAVQIVMKAKLTCTLILDRAYAFFE